MSLATYRLWLCSAAVWRDHCQCQRLANVVAASDGMRVLSPREKTILQLQETDPALAAQLLYHLARIVSLKMVSLFQKSYDLA